MNEEMSSEIEDMLNTALMVGYNGDTGRIEISIPMKFLTWELSGEQAERLIEELIPMLFNKIRELRERCQCLS